MAAAGSEAVGRLFDELAGVYDQSGVAFFGPIAERLVTLLDPQRDERAVDLGCGRGAVTVRLAHRVGPRGRVTALDLAPGMVAATRAECRRSELSWVETEVGDAAAPEVPPGSVSIVAASLVLFFLPDPLAALQRWLQLLEPGGRLGITTFGAQDEVWRQVDGLFDPYLPAGLLDPRTSGRRGPFGSAAALAAMIEGAGGAVAESVEVPFPVRFDDVDQWERFSRGTGQRQMWDRVPVQEQNDLRNAAAGLLESARPTPGGPIELSQVVRFTLIHPGSGGSDAPS